MFRNMYRNILFYITTNFSCSFFGDKTTEATDINIFSSRESILNFFEHRFECNQHIYFGNSCLFRYLVYEIGFSHFYNDFVVYNALNSLQMAANNVNKSFSQLAEEIGLSQDILNKLEQHSIDAATIPRELCHRLVKVLQRPLAAVEMYLGLVTHKQLTQGVAETLASYYVEAQPGLDMHSLSFQQAIEQSKNLSDEQKVVWHSILEREGLL